MTLSDYVSIVRRRWPLIVCLVAAACCLAGYAANSWNEPLYQANSKIIVNKTSVENGKVAMAPGDVAVNAMLLNTYRELIKTPAILQKSAKALSPRLNVSADQLMQSLKISTVAGSQIINVTWEDRSYARASAIVNAVTGVFQLEAPGILMTDNTMIVIPSSSDAPPVPQKTNLAFFVLVAFVASLIVAVFIAYLLELFNFRLKEAGQVEQLLGIPVMAGIPEIRKNDIRHVKQAAAASFKRVGEEQHVHVNG